MDEEIKNQITKLREYGLSDSKINVLLEIAFDEYLDEMEEDLLQANMKDIDSLQEMLKTNEDSNTTLMNIFQKVYGINAESKLKAFMLTYLENCVSEAGQVKDFVSKAQNNDPDTLRQVANAQDDPDYEAAKTAYETATKI
ncbi:MAG: hypothetical protein AB9915_03690 [Candidatus Dojkabacteria bacterium]